MAVDAIDWDDPCQAYGAYRKSYNEILTGGQKTEVTYMANGVTRTVRYAQTDLKTIERVMERARLECEGKGRSRRFAITPGASRRWW